MMPAFARVARHSRLIVSSAGSRRAAARARRASTAPPLRISRRARRTRNAAASRARDRTSRRATRPPNSAEGHRRIGQAERRQPDLRDRLAERLGGDGERVHVRRLALVGRHAGRGVALDVLDRAHALARREPDVARGDVVLEIDERLGELASLHRRDDAERRRPTRRPRPRRAAPAPALRRPPLPRPPARLRERRGEIEHATAGADRVCASPARPAETSASPRRTPACRAIARTDARSASSRRSSRRSRRRSPRGCPAAPSDHSRATSAWVTRRPPSRAEDRRMGLDPQPPCARRLRPTAVGARRANRRSWRSRSPPRRDRARRDRRRRARSRRRSLRPA